MGRTLRHGFTTGACAAAAAKGAALMLRKQRRVEEVELPLPAGFVATFRLQGQRFDASSAACFVVKDAGDDPDVTHGVEVHAEVRIPPPSPPLAKGEGPEGWGVIIEGGIGIGRVTKPGLAVPVGEWAINPVPRRMITEAIREVFPSPQSPVAISCRLSIPDGEERAKRTLNARLGIVGGLSILGTTGVVRPISHQAWTDTLDTALDVALACGCETVVLSTGRTSELAAQQFCRDSGPGTRDRFTDEAFIMMGDHVGHALDACHRRGFAGIVLAAQFAKLVKIACGHDLTHVRASRLELAELASWARACGLDEAAANGIELANTAREAFLEAGENRALLAAETARRALREMARRAPGATMVILLVGYDGRPYEWFGKGPRQAQGETER